MSDDTAPGDDCPIANCKKTVADGHWYASPRSYHSYHTDKEGIAQVWEHIDGMDVTPPTEPYPEGTIGHRRSIGAGATTDG